MSAADADFEARVPAVLASLGRGEVVTYGDVAAEAGSPGAARAVGNLLRRGLPEAPWWRVVGADGRVTSPNTAEQVRRLAAEGVTVVDGRVRPWARPRRPPRQPQPQPTPPTPPPTPPPSPQPRG